MAVSGDLRDMPLTTLISVNCNERNRSRLRLQREGQEAVIFFDEGQIAHITLGDREEEEVIYELLTWEDGRFELEMDIPPPAHTVSTSWSNLVLEGMRLIDEGTLELEADVEEESWAIEPIEQKEVNEMAVRKKRSEQLSDALSELLADSADIEGGALVGIDGLVVSANVPIGDLDETLVGAAAATISGLSKRSAEQMKRGEFMETLIRGSKGYIIISSVDERNVFVGLTPANVNLGMVFTETREVVQKLADIMGG